MLWKYLKALWHDGFAFWEGGDDWYSRIALIVGSTLVLLGAVGVPIATQAPPPLPQWFLASLLASVFFVVAPFLAWRTAQRRIAALEAQLLDRPDVRLRLLQDQYLLWLEVENIGADAEFDVRIDISRAMSIPERIHGFHPAYWLNDEVKVTKTIVEGTAERVLLRSIHDDAGKYIDRFMLKNHFGGMARVLACTHVWTDGAASASPAEKHVVVLKISAVPRLRTGPKTIEIEIEGRSARVISGDVHPLPVQGPDGNRALAQQS